MELFRNVMEGNVRLTLFCVNTCFILITTPGLFIIVARCKQVLMFASQMPYCYIAAPSTAVTVVLPHGLGS